MSFGAAISDGWLYVYGGHIAPRHSYSTSAVSGRFNRLKSLRRQDVGSASGWPPLQGLNRAAHGGKIYRIGGMQPRNKADEPQDVRSVADVARFDPSTREWEALPPLPAPRSSHDVVVAGDTLIVVGGWALGGKEEDAVAGQHGRVGAAAIADPVKPLSTTRTALRFVRVGSVSRPA